MVVTNYVDAGRSDQHRNIGERELQRMKLIEHNIQTLEMLERAVTDYPHCMTLIDLHLFAKGLSLASMWPKDFRDKVVAQIILAEGMA